MDRDHSKRYFLLALLAYTALSVIIFGRSFPADRLFVPMHTDRTEPWRSELTPERSAELAKGEVTSASDKLISFRADDQITIEALRAGELPLWNPTNAGGVPHLAQALYGVFYPFNALYRWLEPERAYGFLAALHHLLAALFTFLFLCRIGAGGFGALVGGLAFGFSTYLMMRAHYYQYVECFAWLPLGLYLVERWFASRSLLSLAGLALVTATVLLSGWPQTAVFTIYAWVLLAVYRSAAVDLRLKLHKVIGAILLVLAAAVATDIFVEETGRANLLAFAPWAAALLVFLTGSGKWPFLRRMLWFGVALLVGGMIASIQYLPGVEWMPFANRTALGAPGGFIANGLRPEFLLDLVVPGFFGSPEFSHLDSLYNLPRMLAFETGGATGEQVKQALLAEFGSANKFGNLVENTLYVGLLPLVLALAGAIARVPRRGFLLLLALVYGGFALGVAWIVYPTYFGGFLVGVDPRRALGVLAFAICCLAGLGLGPLRQGWGRTMVRVTALVLTVAAAAALCLGLLASGGTLLGPLVDNAQRIAALLEMSGDIPHEAFDANAALVRETLLRFGVVGLLSAAGLFLLVSRGFGAVRGGVLAAIIAADLAVAAWPLTCTQPAAGFLRDHALVERLRQTTGHQGRLCRYFGGLGEPSLTGTPLCPNLAGCHGLLDAWCYTVSPPRRWVDLVNSAAPDRDLNGGTFIWPLRTPEHLAARALDLMAVRSIIGFGEVPENLPPGITLDARFGPTFVLKNERALPRVFTVASVEDGSDLGQALLLKRLLSELFDPRSRVLLEGENVPSDHGCVAAELPQAVIVGDERERVTVRLEGGKSAGMLVLLDSFAPGWRVTVDGEEAPVFLADYAFRAVPFHANAREVVFTYDPASVAIGKSVSLAGLGIALLGILIGLLRRPRQPATSTSEPSPSPAS